MSRADDSVRLESVVMRTLLRPYAVLTSTQFALRLPMIVGLVNGRCLVHSIYRIVRLGHIIAYFVWTTVCCCSLGKVNHLPVRLRMGDGMLKEKRLRYAYISRDYESDNSKGMFRQIGRFLIICAGDCAVEEWVFPKDARVSLKSLIVEWSRRGQAQD